MAAWRFGSLGNLVGSSGIWPPQMRPSVAVVERIALKNTTIESLKAVACIFASYHSIKCMPSNLTIAYISSTDSSSHVATAVSFADAFLALARDIRLQCRLSHRLQEHYGRYLLSQDVPFLEHETVT